MQYSGKTIYIVFLAFLGGPQYAYGSSDSNHNSTAEKSEEAVGFIGSAAERNDDASPSGSNARCFEQTLVFPGMIENSGFSYIRGTRTLKNGDVVIEDPVTSKLWRAGKSSGKRVVLADLPDPKSIAIGQDDYVYLTHGSIGGEIRRINPDRGDYTVLYSESGKSFEGISFSPEYDRLYFNEEMGSVHEKRIDASGLVSDEKLLTTIDKVEILDGMAVDECGNLYLVETSAIVWRVDPKTGKKEVAVDFTAAKMGPMDPFVPAINFGSGKGGWKADSFYAMNFSGGVFAVDIGVRGKSEPHLSR